MVLYTLPSVRWAGHVKYCARVLGIARAMAWSMCPAASSLGRMSPPSSGRLLAVAPQFEGPGEV